MATAALSHVTPEEYLARERHAEFRSEYLDGRVLAMTGASPEHADIVLNLGSELRAQLRPRGCRVFVNDVRVRIGTGAGYLYPDVVAVCGAGTFLDTRPRTLADPQLIVEVLSDATDSRDRGEKLEAYRTIASLAEYVLVDSRRVKVERYVRRGDFWAYSAESHLEGTLELSSVDARLALRSIYADVQFEPRADQPPPET